MDTTLCTTQSTATLDTMNTDVASNSTNTTDNDSSFVATLHFKNNEIRLMQQPREREHGGADNTGWCVWECANVMLRAIDKPEWLSRLYAYPLDQQQERFEGLTCVDLDNIEMNTSKKTNMQEMAVLDFSAGAGTLGIALGTVGTNVVCTEIEEQMELLKYNIQLNNVTKNITTSLCYWGDNTAKTLMTAFPPKANGLLFDLTLCSDVLFIAIRDNLCKLLKQSLVQLCTVSELVLFGFEERLPDEEQAFMLDLAQSDDVVVTELTGECIELKQEESMQGIQGNVAGGTLVGDMFWEAPPIRLFMLRRKLTK